MQAVTILGSTGSIGVSTLDVIARNPGLFRVHALTAHQNVTLMREQVSRFRPALAVMQDPAAAEQLRRALPADCPTRVLAGEEGMLAAARDPVAPVVMAAVVGAAGLLPTLAAVQAGKKVLLANKESLVMAGHLFMQAVAEYGATLLPIDSEHNAIFQCLPGPGNLNGVRKIILTGSGGPFLETELSELAVVSPDQACAHPNWSMGRKISVDSATMMNKGLELIEACWLFGIGPEQVEIVLHPQSIIHSMVEYVDGSILAQLGNPDMRTPIAHGLAWPERIDSGVASLDLIAAGRLDFRAPDFQRFPCLRLAIAAIHRGGTAMAILNAANEVAVAAFLEERVRFTDIPVIIEHVLDVATVAEPVSLAAVQRADQHARALARDYIDNSLAA